MSVITSWWYLTIASFCLLCSIFYIKTEKASKMGFIQTGILLVTCMLWPLLLFVYGIRWMFGKRIATLITNKLLENLAVGTHSTCGNTFEYRMLVMTRGGRVRKLIKSGGTMICNTYRGDIIYFAVKMLDTSEIRFFTSTITYNGGAFDINTASPATEEFIMATLSMYVPDVLIKAFIYSSHPDLPQNIPAL